MLFIDHNILKIHSRHFDFLFVVPLLKGHYYIYQRAYPFKIGICIALNAANSDMFFGSGKDAVLFLLALSIHLGSSSVFRGTSIFGMVKSSECLRRLLLLGSKVSANLFLGGEALLWSDCVFKIPDAALHSGESSSKSELWEKMVPADASEWSDRIEEERVLGAWASC